jgi:hypothetical protein
MLGTTSDRSECTGSTSVCDTISAELLLKVTFLLSSMTEWVSRFMDCPEVAEASPRMNEPQIKYHGLFFRLLI